MHFPKIKKRKKRGHNAHYRLSHRARRTGFGVSLFTFYHRSSSVFLFTLLLCILCAFITWLVSVSPLGLGCFHWFFSFSYPQRPFIDGRPRNAFSAYLFCLLLLLFIFRGICSLALIYPDTERASREIYHHFLYIHIFSHQPLFSSVQIFPLSTTPSLYHVYIRVTSRLSFLSVAP